MRDLFGERGPAKPARRSRKLAKPAAMITSMVPSALASSSLMAVSDMHLQMPGVDPAAVESFRALGAAVCLDSPLGTVWLVPEYTREPRAEVSAADLAKVIMVQTTFPGSHIASFKSPHTVSTAGESPEAHSPSARRSK